MQSDYILEILSKPDAYIQQIMDDDLEPAAYKLMRGKKKLQEVPADLVNELWHDSHTVAGLGKILKLKDGTKVRWQYRFYLPKNAFCPVCHKPLKCSNLIGNEGLPLFLECPARHKQAY